MKFKKLINAHKLRSEFSILSNPNVENCCRNYCFYFNYIEEMSKFFNGYGDLVVDDTGIIYIARKCKNKIKGDKYDFWSEIINLSEKFIDIIKSIDIPEDLKQKVLEFAENDQKEQEIYKYFAEKAIKKAETHGYIIMHTTKFRETKKAKDSFIAIELQKCDRVRGHFFKQRFYMIKDNDVQEISKKKYLGE